VTAKAGKELSKKDAEKAFDGTQYGVTSFDEKKKGKKKKEAA
jgi:hypothetical protein